MKKPDKKKVKDFSGNDFLYGRNLGYNQACSDWEEWIKEADIEGIIKSKQQWISGHNQRVILGTSDLTQEIRNLLLKK